MKKFVAIIISIIMTTGSLCAFAERSGTYSTGSEDFDPTEVYPQTKPLGASINVDVDNGVPNITINGTEMVFPDAQPFIDSNNRTQIPIRALAETLGCTVDWNSDLQRVTFTHPNGLFVYLTIGDNLLYVDDSTVNMDTTAMIIDDRTYVPMLYISRAFGVNVIWHWME